MLADALPWVYQKCPLFCPGLAVSTPVLPLWIWSRSCLLCVHLEGPAPCQRLGSGTPHTAASRVSMASCPINCAARNGCPLDKRCGTHSFLTSALSITLSFDRQSASTLRASAEPPPCMLGPFGGLPRSPIAVHDHFQPSTGRISPIVRAGGCCKGYLQGPKR
jgi:hypothetical protein